MILIIVSINITMMQLYYQSGFRNISNLLTHLNILILGTNKYPKFFGYLREYVVQMDYLLIIVSSKNLWASILITDNPFKI